MKNKKNRRSSCALCLAIGSYFPWLLLALGGVLSALDVSAALNEEAAYITAIGVAILLISYFMRRLTVR